MNLQELATVKHNELPIKIFVINNNGYLLIRHTQTTHFDGRLIGESPKTGLFIPDTVKIAKAYGLKAIQIRSVNELDNKLKEVLAFKGPVVCDILSPEWQPIIPRVSSQKLADGKMVSKPFEDMYPFLAPDELRNILSFGSGKNIFRDKKIQTKRPRD
jgi:acetolactate synthase-1/2/3 large subunit